MNYKGRDLVAVILAVGLVVALNLALIAVVWDVAVDDRQVSDGGADVLLAALAGILGILGAYVGYRSGHRPVVDQTGTGAVRSSPDVEAPSSADF